MSLKDCIAMWNKGCNDDDNHLYEIHETHDDYWWDEIKENVDGYWFMRNILESESFNLTDRYFFYDSEGRQFCSFSTKAELMELTSRDWFINELMNR